MHNRIKLSLVVLIFLTGIVGLRQSYKVTAQRNPPASKLGQGEIGPQRFQDSLDTQDRIIEKRSNSAFPNEPVEIIVVRTKKINRRFGEKFKDDDEWVQGLSVTVKNISSKNATYINVHVSFERPEESEAAAEPTLVHSLVFGTKSPPTGKPLQVLAPSTTIDISLPDHTYAALKGALKKVGYPASIEHVELYLTEVLFEDGTMWADGYLFRRDPANQDNWIPVEKERDIPPGQRQYR
ncbi:MAG: hypothetical protein ABI698_07620 [bacterium]